MTKKPKHSDALNLFDTAQALWDAHIQPYKSKKKSERPSNYDAVLKRINRLRKGAAEIEERTGGKTNAERGIK